MSILPVQNTLHIIGDSTLDNIHWVNDHTTDSVEANLLQKGHTLVNNAFDGFTTQSLLTGDTVGRVFRKSPGYLAMRGVSGFINPLERLKAAIDARPNDTHYVLLSVGGNDFREKLHSPVQMLMDIPNIHTRYMQIVDTIKGMGNNVRPILMLQYRLDARPNHDHYGIYKILGAVGGIFATAHTLSASAIAAAPFVAVANVVAGVALGAFGLLTAWATNRVIPFSATLGLLKGQDIGMSSLGGLMETFYKPILAKAKQENIPVLDLPNTFNPYKPLYMAQIEPNKAGGALIAEGIDHIVRNHDFAGPSQLYAKGDTDLAYKDAPNPGSSGWKVHYPKNV